ncbi:unnamed protein product [Gadus morhua 'NCC']
MLALPPTSRLAVLQGLGHSVCGTLKSKELSPVIGHKGIQVVGPTVPLSSCPPLGSQSPHSTEPSPHTLRKGSKKLAPGPPKVPYGGGVSDQSAGGQPSPVSLSPTPPSTPSPYGPACPPGPLMALGASPGGGQPPPPPGGGPYSLSSPPSLAGTLTKSRPGHSKPRQRPSLPPPQPPSAPPPDPELLEGLSPGESMSTDIFNYEIPPINVNLDSLIDEFSGAPCRRYMGYYMADSPEGDAVAEEEPQSTTL